MKFRVERDVLADAVAWAARTLPSRPSMPVLAGLVLEASEDSVTLSSFDYEVSSRVTIAADVQTPGTSLVSGRLLADITRSLPGAPVQLSNEGTRVVITCGRSSFTLPTLPVEDYPSLPAMPDSSGDIEAALFASAVAQVAIAAGRDDSLPTLTGVHVEINEDTVTFAATDRYRLAVREIQWAPSSPNTTTTALLRARTIADAAKSLTGSKDVSLSFAPNTSNDRLAGFAGDGKTMTSRMLDGTFPPYRHLLPQEVTTTALIEVATLLDSVRRVALVTDKTVPLRLDFANNTLSLEAGAGEEAQATEAIEILLTGEPISIAFNPTFLADGLNAVGTKFVQISFTGSNKPAILMGKSDKDGAVVENYRYLLMPMRYAS